MSARDVDLTMGTGPADGDSSRAVEAALRRVLNEPATPTELAGWDAVAAAYRDAVSPQRATRPRLAAGLPLSLAAAAAVLLPAGAVAAAYTGRLPAHVQHWAHRVLAPIGVPSHRHSTPNPQRHALSTPSPSPSVRLTRPVGAATLPARQQASAVRLCVALSRTPPEKQSSVLSALRRLMPTEPDLQETCHTLLLRERSPRPSAHPSSVRRSSAHPSLSPSPGASASASPKAVTSPAPTPRASGHR